MLHFVTRPTPQLVKLVKQAKGTHTPEDFNLYLQELKTIYLKIFGILSEIEPGIERALAAQKILSDQIEKTPSKKISCAKGCGACCHLEVEVTKEEGELLAHVVLAGTMIDFKRLQEQASRERRSPEWASFDTPNNRCVFLGEEQACTVYDYRPMMCRKHLVESPPAQCAIGRMPVPILMPMAEVVMSAYLSQPNNPTTSLPKSLRDGLENIDPLPAGTENLEPSPMALDEEPTPIETESSDLEEIKLV